MHFHINLLKGMSLWTQEFGEVGLDTQAIMSSLKSIGSFLTKAIEFQQVIDVSIRNVKVFFRWLYTVMYRLYGNPSITGQTDTPTAASTNEIIRISQQDLETVQEFIDDNFEHLASDDEDGSEVTAWEGEGSFSDKKKRPKMKSNMTPSWSSPINPRYESIFTLDHVGQYLEDQELTKQPLRKMNTDLSSHSNNKSPWLQFLDSDTGRKIFASLDDTYSISLYHHNERTSLIQESKLLIDELERTFQSLQTSLSVKEDLFCSSFPCTENSVIPASVLSSSLTNVQEGCCYTAIAPIFDNSNTDYDYISSQLSNTRFAAHLIVMKQSLIQERTTIEINFVRFVENGSPVVDNSMCVDGDVDADAANNNLYIVQVEFYNSEHLFVLLKDLKGSTYIARIPIFILMEGSSLDDISERTTSLETPDSVVTISLTSDLSTLSGIHYRKMTTPGQKWTKMAVSGPRNVACISSLRKVKIFETDLAEVEGQDILDESNDAMDTTNNGSTLDVSL
jgi:hypothetical protein